MDAVVRALWVPINMTNIKVSTHSMQAWKSQLVLKQVNNSCVVRVRVDISEVAGTDPDPQHEDQDVPVVYEVPAECRAKSGNALVDVHKYTRRVINFGVSYDDRPGGA
jgi:hypothetical protein